MLANRFDIFGLTAVQLTVVALVCIPFVVVDGFGDIDNGVILTVIFTGIGCSAVAFGLSAWAQRTIDASRASILNLLEPVVAGVVGYAVGERLGVTGYVGAALILAGIFVAERGTHAAGRHSAAVDRSAGGDLRKDGSPEPLPGVTPDTLA